MENCTWTPGTRSDYYREHACTNAIVKGWVSQPDSRGTFDILWTCLVTSFICTYSMLVLNVPAGNDNLLTLIRRRLMWMCIGIMGPEFPLTYAAGQWSRARHSVRAFAAHVEYSGWNMRLAFFADMGGFVLQARDSTPFPINAKQLYWLVTNHKIGYPQLTAEELWDKSKQDRFVRFVTAFQAGYFILQCIGRASQNFAITTLELNTLAIVICSLMTSFVWLHKPSEVRVPVILSSQLTIEEITQNQPWDLTPLDFIDNHSPGYSVNVQPFIKMPVIPPQRPIQRIPDDRFPTDPYGLQEYFLCLATIVFTGLHITGWNYYFPTFVEQILWRISSLLLFTLTVAFWFLETAASCVRLGTWKKLQHFIMRQRCQAEADPENLQRRTPLPFPQPWEFWSISAIAVLYGIARLYMVAEGFVELRRLPASAYMSVNWSEYVPHI